MFSSSLPYRPKRPAATLDMTSSPEPKKQEATTSANSELESNGSKYHGHNLLDSNSTLSSVKSTNEADQEKLTNYAATGDCYILAMPQELQDMIFSYAMTDDHAIPLQWTGRISRIQALKPVSSNKAFKTMVALRATCKHIRTNVQTEYYSKCFLTNNTFSLGGSDQMGEYRWFAPRAHELQTEDERTAEFLIALKYFQHLQGDFVTYHQKKMESRGLKTTSSAQPNELFWMNPWVKGSVKVNGLENLDKDRSGKVWIAMAWSVLHVWEYNKIERPNDMWQFGNVFQDLTWMVKKAGRTPPSIPMLPSRQRNLDRRFLMKIMYSL